MSASDPAVRKYIPAPPEPAAQPPKAEERAKVAEIGGRRDGSEPTRFGDWEKQGRCIDF